MHVTRNIIYVENFMLMKKCSISWSSVLLYYIRGIFKGVLKIPKNLACKRNDHSITTLGFKLQINEATHYLVKIHADIG